MEWKLKQSKSFKKPQGPVVIVILDGVGVGKEDKGNAVALAYTPTIDRLLKEHPNLLIRAHGTAVGLPSNKDMGNSEVGHNALGGGRILDQGAKLVNKAIETQEVFRTKTWKTIVSRCKKKGALHLIGLVSDGNVHSHIDHLEALIKRADEENIERLFVHALLDGRDVPEKSALEYIDKVELILKSINDKENRKYMIASGGGRMKVTMDRYESDWSIVEKGWRAHVLGEGRSFESAREAIEVYRNEDPKITDQFMDSFVIQDKGEPVGTIEDGDCVLFFNFRGDRALEISRAFEEEDFDKFDRVRVPEVFYVGMLRYDGDLGIPKNYLLPPPRFSHTMGEYLSKNKYRQVACAETQKYGHVTYFWNGNHSGAFDEDLETYIEVKSDRLPFEERPWMKAGEVTDKFIEALKEKKPHFARLNYANGDMVGHTGNLRSTRIAIESVDLCLDKILSAVSSLNGCALITADHGNADEMFMKNSKTDEIKRDSSGAPSPKTSHTLNPVFLILYDPKRPELSLDDSIENKGLGNVAATAFELMGIEPPADYLPSLLSKKKIEGIEKPCNPDDLTHRAASGDTDVLNEIVHCFENSLLRFARRYCKHQQDAHDVVQDAYEAATKYLDGFQGNASIKTWLTKLVMSACSKKKRGARNDPNRHVSINDLSGKQAKAVSKGPDAERDVLRREILLDVQKALRVLNETDRAVLLLRDGKEMTSEETASFLNLSVPAVKSRLHRARKSIRKFLEEKKDSPK